MTTLKDFERWQRVQEKADELKQPVEDHLRAVWKDYSKLYKPFSGNRFPDCVESISRTFNGNINISGSSSYRGHTDYESCSMPIEFAFGDEASRVELIRQKELEDQVAHAEAIRVKELRELAEYERLQAKFGVK